MARQVKDPVSSLEQLRLLLWCEFDPSLGTCACRECSSPWPQKRLRVPEQKGFESQGNRGPALSTQADASSSACHPPPRPRLRKERRPHPSACRLLQKLPGCTQSDADVREASGPARLPRHAQSIPTHFGLGLWGKNTARSKGRPAAPRTCHGSGSSGSLPQGPSSASVHPARRKRRPKDQLGPRVKRAWLTALGCPRAVPHAVSC